MNEEIDWKALGGQLGTLGENGTELVSGRHARQAIEILIGEDNLRKTVDYYISGKPGSELARFVLWQIHPWSAMKYCYDIYKSDRKIQARRLAVELLRVVADERALDWVGEFLEDQDLEIQVWGIGVLDQLLYSRLVELEDTEHLLQRAESHDNLQVRERAAFIRDFVNEIEPQDTEDET